MKKYVIYSEFEFKSVALTTPLTSAVELCKNYKLKKQITKLFNYIDVSYSELYIYFLILIIEFEKRKISKMYNQNIILKLKTCCISHLASRVYTIRGYSFVKFIVVYI